MIDKNFKNILITMFIIFLAAIPLLYFLSDPRDQSVKKVENEFGIRLPKSVKRERELYKEPSFHGDGQAAILFSFDKKDLGEIKNELEAYQVIKDENKKSQVETCLLKVKERGFDTSLDMNNKIYFKATSEYIFEGMYGNFVALILYEDKGEILFLEWDT